MTTIMVVAVLCLIVDIVLLIVARNYYIKALKASGKYVSKEDRKQQVLDCLDELHNAYCISQSKDKLSRDEDAENFKKFYRNFKTVKDAVSERLF